MLALPPFRNAPEILGLRGQQEPTEEQRVTAGITPLLKMKELERTQENRYTDLFNTLLCFLLQREEGSMLSSSSPLAMLAATTQANSFPTLYLSKHLLRSSLGPRRITSFALSRPRPGCLLQWLSFLAIHSIETVELKA